jgi:hypothetical protein
MSDWQTGHLKALLPIRDTAKRPLYIARKQESGDDDSQALESQLQELLSTLDAQIRELMEQEDISGVFQVLYGLLQLLGHPDVKTQECVLMESPIVSTLCSLLRCGNVSIQTHVLQCLVEVSHFTGNELFGPDDVSGLISLVLPSNHDEIPDPSIPADYVFKLIRNIGLPVFQFVSLLDLFHPARSCDGTCLMNLAGLLCSIAEQELPGELSLEILQFIRFCFDEGLESVFEYNFWTLRLLLGRDLFQFLLPDFWELHLLQFCEFGILSRDPDLQRPALQVVGLLFSKWEVPRDPSIGILLTVVTSCFMNSRHSVVRLNSILVLSDLLKQCPDFCQDMHAGEVWQKIVQDFDIGSFAVKRASVSFLANLIRVLEPGHDLIGELIGGGIFGFMCSAIEIGDGAIQRTALRALSSMVKRIPSEIPPEGMQFIREHWQEEVVGDVLNDLWESIDEKHAPQLNSIMEFAEAMADDG